MIRKSFRKTSLVTGAKEGGTDGNSENNNTSSSSNGGEELTKLKGEEQLSGVIGKKYKLLVQILTSDPRYAKALADVIKPSQHEKLSIALNDLTYEIGASLNIIKSLIGLEFNRKSQHPTTILRVNSIVSKMMGKYTTRMGTKYLDALIGDLVREIYNSKSLNLETDSARITTNTTKQSTNQQEGESSSNDVNDLAKKNLQALEETCQKFVDRITAPAMIDLMPREIKAIAYFLAEAGEKYKLDFDTYVMPLISGFIMLRYIAPAITLPQNAGIVTKIPEGNVRTNLTYIAKVCQKLANGEKFEIEAPHLMPMNQFLERNKQKWRTYIKNIFKDPNEQEGRLPFGDLVKTITFEDIHLRKFNIEDLIFLHGLIYDYGYEMIVSLQTEVILTEDKRPMSVVSTETDFLTLVHDLGPPPERESKRKKTEDDPKKNDKTPKKGDDKTKVEGEKKKGEKVEKENLKGKSFQEIEKAILSKSLDNLMNYLDKFDLSELDNSRFLYIGKPSKNKIPTIYIVLSRIKPEFLENTDQLLVYTYKTLYKKITEPYLLIVDMSWMKFTDEMQAALYRAIVAFMRIMKKEHIENCKQIYLLHPTYKTMKGIDTILNILEGGAKNKIIKTAYEWTDLVDIIDPQKIWIPFVSKKFVPITYSLIKLNNQNKKQERLMKISHDSILNVDNKNGTVHNEILLLNIQEIRSSAQGNEILIKYTPETEDSIKERQAGYFLKPFKNTATQSRKYQCFSEGQRDMIVSAVFEAGIMASSLKLPQIFVVKKENENSKFQERVLKLTLDSVLNFKDRIIKREIPYSTIQSFYVDPERKDILYINFTEKGEKKCYVLQFEQAETLRLALLDAILRFRFSIEAEKELFLRNDVDGIMDRFFYEKKTKVKDDDDEDDVEDKEKWKTILRIDQPVKRLKKLFKRFNPSDTTDRARISTDIVKDVLSQMKVDMTDDEINHIVVNLDPNGKGEFSYDDLVKSFIFLRRSKVMIAKKKASVVKVQKTKDKKTKKKGKDE